MLIELEFKTYVMPHRIVKDVDRVRIQNVCHATVDCQKS